MVQADLYDAAGRLVRPLMRDARLASGTHELAIDASNFEAGAYFFRIRAGDRVGSGKLVVLR
jgi:hypothetical protein